MTFKNYYHILGLTPAAGQAAIKKAFRQLARQYHPDVNPDNPHTEERFKLINEAYEVLRNPAAKAAFDQTLPSDSHRQASSSPASPPSPDPPDSAPESDPRQEVYVDYHSARDLNDLFGVDGRIPGFFNGVFSGMSGSETWHSEPEPKPYESGQDQDITLEISLTEAYHGTIRLINKGTRRLEVKIPPGVKTGSRVKITGGGKPGSGGAPSGDLFLTLQVAADRRFERLDRDLFITLPVDLYTAILGGLVEVPTLAGRTELILPECCQNGQTFRVAGYGMPGLKNPQRQGDLFVRLAIRLPRELTPEQRRLFEQLRHID